MNKMTFATLAAAAALAGGVAFAQSSDVQPKSSTPGAGCTATGNAMSAGNLGGTATNKNCNTTGVIAATPVQSGAVAATPVQSGTVATPAAPATASTDTTTSSSTSSMAAAPSTDTTTAPKRVARADRG